MAYQMMMAARQAFPNRMMSGNDTDKKMYCILLDCQERFLNLSENIGISATNSHDVSNTNRMRYNALNLSEIRKLCPPAAKELQKRALAGVGIPMKDVVCLVSMLNFANRNAEKMAIMNAA